MGGRHQLHAGADLDVVADPDFGGIQNDDADSRRQR
jgi:hypothetical protein